MRKKETRGDCPVCGYANAYTETITNEGKRIGWCASCQDKEAIAVYLGSGKIPYSPSKLAAMAQDRAERAAKAKQRAATIWSGAGWISDFGPAAIYLRSRQLGRFTSSPALRYREDCPHPDGKRYPAMVAQLVDMYGVFHGVHRTFLTHDGKKANLVPAKASLGTMWGCGVMLPQVGWPGWQPTWSAIVVAEGIESAASAGLLLDLPAIAAVSAGNLASGLALHRQFKEVMIAADNDKPGLVAAEAAMHRWQSEGRIVRIMKAAIDGHDFNDVLMGKTS